MKNNRNLSVGVAAPASRTCVGRKTLCSAHCSGLRIAIWIQKWNETTRRKQWRRTSYLRYLDDETQGDGALSLLNRFVDNEVGLVAPALLEYEVINGLIIAQRRGRIPESTFIDAISAFQGLGIKQKYISGLGPMIFSL